MAGIGFKIEKILQEEGFIASLKAHFYSAFITSGPWILSIITIFSLNYFSPKNIDTFQLLYFRTAITYIFAFSLIVTGVLYLSLSRYLADKLYLKEEEALIPAFNSAALFVLTIQSIFGIFIFYSIDLSFWIKFLSVLIYLVISMVWLIMIFLTTLRDYQSIFSAYAIGAGVSVGLGIFLGGRLGLLGYLLGYFIGHFLIIILLSCRIFVEFTSKRTFDWALFIFLARNKILVLIGLVYNLAIWIDKIVFWNSSRAFEVSSILRIYPEYESAVFFAYLTIIPTLSLFLIHVETEFYRKYKLFYAQILEKGTYPAIRQAKMEMAYSLRNSIMVLITFQGLATLLFITFAPALADLLRLKFVSIPTFRIATLGAFLHGLLLVNIIVILYFDFQALALLVVGIFLASNWLFTYLTVLLPIQFLGYGYFASVLFSLIAAYYFLNFKFRRLEYLTFASQPLGVHREEEVA